MVQLMRSDTDNNHCLKKVKLEVQDEIPPLHSHKRPKLESPPKCGSSDDSLSIPPASYNPLDEPSPLGLRLRKSPSLLDLIQMRLSQQEESKKKDQKASAAAAAAAAAAADSKLKASNFPGTILKIGTWEYKSRYEGDLVAKCYFAKHKLVWEVLDGCLKNKIEIPWSDIMAIKASYPEDGPGTLEVVLARRPLFFREINPQPRKHTLWQATSDFTGGQASVNRRHFLQCPQGLLGKHFEKLVQCDPRLNYLSQQPDLVLDSPYFEPGTTSIHDHIESSDGFDRKSEERAGSIFGLQDVDSGSAVQSSSSKSEHNLGKAVENVSQEITSPSSVMNIHAMKDFRSRGAETLKFLSNLDQIKLPGLHPSMSMDDLVSHIGHCISEQMGSDNPNLGGDSSQYSRSILEEFTQYLFNDSQHATTSDEQRVMSRVNSLYCLLQKDPSTAAEDTNTTMTKNGNANMLSRVNSLYSLLQNAEDTMTRNGNGLRDADVMSRVNSLYCLLQKDPSTAEDEEGGKVGVSNSNLSPCKTKVLDLEGQPDDASPGCKQGGTATGMSRKESAGDLLLNLPRIASLPQFLFNMSEDSVNKVR